MLVLLLREGTPNREGQPERSMAARDQGEPTKIHLLKKAQGPRIEHVSRKISGISVFIRGTSGRKTSYKKNEKLKLRIVDIRIACRPILSAAICGSTDVALYRRVPIMP